MDRYRTRKRSEIVSNLIELGRAREPLTVLFEAGKQSFPTSVIGLVKDNSEVLIEPSNNPELNERFLAQEKGTVIGKPGGIKVRFLLEGVRAIKHEGEKVFAAPLPREHYRMQRRERFRIDIPISNPVKVTIPLPNEREVTLSVGNISSAGLRLDDEEIVLKCSLRDILSNCRIEIPDIAPFNVDLEVFNSYEKVKKNGKTVHYVGCEFKNMPADQEYDIQHYINSLQLAQRALAK